MFRNLGRGAHSVDAEFRGVAIPCSDGDGNQRAVHAPSCLPLQIEDGPNAYIYGPSGTPIEEITADGEPSYYSQDQQGNTTTITDQNDITDANYTYDPYGNTTETGTWQQPFLYNGQYTDPETSLQYLHNRYYDPSTAQFLTPGTIRST